MESIISFIKIMLEYVLPICGYMYGAFMYLYFNKVSFFIFVNKTFRWKKDVNFLIDFSFDGQFDNLKKLKNYFREETKNKLKSISSSKNKEVFQLDTLIITIEKSEIPSDEYGNDIVINNSNSTYSLASKNLKLLQKVFKKILDNEAIGNSKFCFRSDFNKNPFLNRTITRFGVDNIRQLFMIVSTSMFTQQLDEDEDIEINMQSVSYVARDFSDLREVANIILAM